MVAKTVYDLKWKPSLASLIILLVVSAAVMYLPYFLQLPIFLNPTVGLAIEIGFCVGVVLFFYSGIKFVRLFPVLMLQIANVSFFGALCNLFHQATFLVTVRMLATDFLPVGLMNIGAVALTLSFYRITQSRIEVAEGASAPPRGHYPVLVALTPVVMLLPVAVACSLMINSRYVPNGATFAITIYFFMAAQFLLNVGGAFFIFKTKTRPEKIKLSLCVVSLAMFYGTVGNITQHITQVRPGFRLVLHSTEFIIMNAFAIVTVYVFVSWMNFLREEKAKQDLIKSDDASAPPETKSISASALTEASAEPAQIATAATTDNETSTPPESSAKQSSTDESQTKVETDSKSKVIKTKKTKEPVTVEGDKVQDSKSVPLTSEHSPSKDTSESNV